MRVVGPAAAVHALRRIERDLTAGFIKQATPSPVAIPDPRQPRDVRFYHRRRRETPRQRDLEAVKTKVTQTLVTVGV